MTFEEFYDDLVCNERWFETMQMQHKGKNFKQACELVYGDYASDMKNFPDIVSARKHVHYKLAKMKPEPVKMVTNYTPPQEIKLAVLTPEEDKRVHQLLEDYKKKLKSIGRYVPQMTQKEIEERGQERPKAHPHPSTPESVVRKTMLHNQWIRECFDPYTGEPNEYYIEESEWLKHQKQL